MLMLDVANIVTRSPAGKFDTVVFFDRNEEAVNETFKNIPGANGFPADFTKLVLAEDPEEEAGISVTDPLGWEVPTLDTAVSREHQRLIAQRRLFIRHFPFDVINLDLEEFLLKPHDEFPGKMVNAFIQILRWQRDLRLPDKSQIDEFVLMYTTQIGPPNLTSDYLHLLQEGVSANLKDNPDLEDILAARTGYRSSEALRVGDFDDFFRIAIPKLLARYLRQEDWLIHPSTGVQIFEFDRASKDRNYKMLHLVMNVARQTPPKEKRGPLQEGTGVKDAYATVAKKLFTEGQIYVSEQTIASDELRDSLDRILARRRKYAGGFID